MKKTLIALATMATLAIAAPLALAQFGPGQQGMRGGPNIEMMARMLDLTPEQQGKMKTLFAEQAKQREAMREAMRTDMQNKMQAILTKDQYAKMQDLRKFRDENRGPGMRGGMGGGMGGCPGQGGMQPK
jgi:Spy/CpxP family protein refolding chaperone